MITINFNAEEPLYLQVYNFFVNEIKQNKIKIGEKIPSIRNLSNHLCVSLNTVINAYEMLLDEGFIVSKEGSGFYVDKFSVENLYKKRNFTREYELSFKDEYKYNFKFSNLDISKMPVSVLKKCTEYAVEKSMKDEEIPKFGLMSLRKEICKYLEERRGVFAFPEDVIVTSGYAEHLFLIMSLIENSYFAMEDPGYKKTMEIFKSFSKNIVPIPIDKYGFSIKDIENTRANVIITTPNHQFPTGIITGIRRRERILNWAYEKKNRYIVEDDYNSDYRYLGSPIPALKSLDRENRVILSGSFSQSIGSFLGISYLVLPKNLREKLERRGTLQSGTSKIQQYTLEKFLSSRGFEKHINRMNTYYRKKRTVLLKKLKNVKGLEVLGAQAGLHVILRLDKDIFDLENFDEKMRKNKIFVNRVKDYSMSEWQDNDVIFGFGGIPIEKIEQAVDEFLGVIRK